MEIFLIVPMGSFVLILTAFFYDEDYWSSYSILSVLPTFGLKTMAFVFSALLD